MERYDAEGTFFYIGPPYYGRENYYGEGIFGKEDFGKPSQHLAGIKGRFLLSINDTPEIREIFGGFEMLEVPAKYSVGGGAREKAVTELLFANYPLKLK